MKKKDKKLIEILHYINSIFWDIRHDGVIEQYTMDELDDEIENLKKLLTKEEEEFKKGYNQRLKDEGKTGERWQHLYL